MQMKQFRSLTSPLLFTVFACAVMFFQSDTAQLASNNTFPATQTASISDGNPSQSACTYSELWGENGEKWKAAGRLPDFSYAGYHAGEANIPSPPAKWNLKRDFHAAGDGHTDDTEAFQKAIQSIKSGVLFIPKGTYIIAKDIDISQSNFVLRGEGSKETILSFPHSLTDLHGNKPQGGQSQWSFRPGLINFKGKDPINAETRLAVVTANAKRGDTLLRISQPVSIKKGQWIRLVESDPAKGSPAAGSLIHYLYGDLMEPGPDLIGTKSVVRFLSRVKSSSGTQIQLERPLPYDVRAEWTPEIHAFVPSLQEVGVEHLALHFPWTPYPGHFKESGYNGLFFDGVSQCWVDDVEIQNGDYGISLDATNFCTVDNVTISTSASRAEGKEAAGANGHHGIDVAHGTENLVTNFDLQTKFVHDISIEWYALHTVFAKGRGVDLNMDHHREANYSSLFSQLDCGAGTRPFNSGGSGDRGAHSGAYNTYWNIRARSALALPPGDFGPLLNFIGVAANEKRPGSTYQWFLEQIVPENLCPADLQEAMRLRRVKG
jgi:hypothetical protein